MIYVDVILPLPLQNSFTYEVPSEFEAIQEGMRVVVQFGQKKIYTAIVFKIHNETPKNYSAKPIINILDHQPIICLLYTSPSPRDRLLSRMPSSA